MTQNDETQTQTQTERHSETQLAQDDLDMITIRPVVLSADPTKKRTIGVSPELMDMVNELRDTVKRIDPRRHTVKTLRRSLANVSDILNDIGQFYPKS
jgi:clumping factor A